jgi:ABC-type antimicrobial peptide transport system permease subunit
VVLLVGAGVSSEATTDALVLVGIGVALGVPAALAATRLLQNLLFQTSRTDPLTYFAVVLCVMVVALAAAYLPARRAARVSPLVSLRVDN